MLGRILMVWGVVGRVHGEWVSPAITVVLFAVLRTIVAAGMALDYLFFPALARTEVRAPIVIVANPRSGTTFLHRWLSDHGFGQGVQLYRSLYPSLTIQTALRPLLPTLEKLNPAQYHSADAHETSLTSVETDDVGIFFRYLDGMFLYSFFLAWDEVEHRDLVDPRKRDLSKRDFAWLDGVWRRNLVATGAATQCAKVFTLAPRIPEFLQRWPEARILYMVRDPLAVLPSTMSLVNVPLEARFKISQLPEDVRKRYFKRLYDGQVELYRAFHDDWMSGRIDRKRVFIVNYDRMMQDFDGMMAEMLPFLGRDASPELMAEIKAVADKQRKHKSKHKYSLEKYYLDEATIRRDLAFVYDTFLPEDPTTCRGLWD